ERHNRDRSESRTLAEGSQGVDHVLAEAVYDREPARIAALSLPRLDGSHLLECAITSFGQCHATSGIVVDEAIEVISHLLIEFLLHARPLQQGSQPETEPAHPAHVCLATQASRPARLPRRGVPTLPSRPSGR